MLVRECEHHELNRELDVHHAAGVVLEIEQRRPIRMPGGHLAPHVDDVARQRGAVARKTQELFAKLLERGADRNVAGHEARARQRLVLPRPCVLPLIAPERRERGHHETGDAIRAETDIDVVERSRGRRRGEPGDELLRELRVALGGRLVRVVVEEDEIEIGRVAELLAAQLAVADDGEPGRRVASPADLDPRGGERGFDDDVGQHRQMIGEALDGEESGEILGEEPEGLRVLEMAQHVELPFRVALVVAHQAPQLLFPRIPIRQ